MISILKMELNRYFKDKNLYISTLIFILFMGICVYMQNSEQIIKGYKGLSGGQGVGFYFTIDYYLNSSLDFIYVFALRYGMFIFGIFLTTFICNEYNSGFIKNSCMMYKNRNVIILKSSFVIIIMSIIIAILAYICSNIFGYLFVKDFTHGNLEKVISYLAVMTIVNIAYFSLILLICTLTRNKVITIVISILITMGLTGTIIENIFKLFNISNFANYTVSKITMTLPMIYDEILSTRAVMVSLALILTYNALSILIINKKDM